MPENSPEITDSETVSRRSSSACSALASRWSEYEIKAATGIVNDIAEGIDNGESRDDLRTSLAIYADLLYDANVNRHLSETSQLLKKLESILPNALAQPRTK